jgi:hypothetical protein
MEMTWLHRARLTAVAGVAVLALGGGIAGSALGETGQPGAPDGNHCGEGSSELTPGNASSAKGSVFNPAGISGEHYAGNPGTRSKEHAASAAAESQYDVACLQTTSH